MRRHVLATAAVLLAAGCANTPTSYNSSPSTAPNSSVTVSIPSQQVEKHVILTIDSARWPNISKHTVDAQLAGKSIVCTLDRPGAATRRTEALRNVPTRPEFDRDEYPPAVCREGGHGADVQYVPSSENRSEGAWLGSQLAIYSDGTIIEIKVSK